jgi:hypothetical protein
VIPWLILRVAPQTEFRALHDVRRLGYDAIVPFEQRWRRRPRSRRPEWYKVPLLPRYLCAQVPWDEFLMARDDARDIQGVLFSDGRPAHMRPADLAYLRTFCVERPPQENINAKALNLGQDARIKTGAMSGRVGKIASLRAKKVGLLLSMFGAMRVVPINIEEIEGVS